jgi:hypothetical protein
VTGREANQLTGMKAAAVTSLEVRGKGEGFQNIHTLRAAVSHSSLLFSEDHPVSVKRQVCSVAGGQQQTSMVQISIF